MVGRARPAALARSTSLMPASASRANNFNTLNGPGDALGAVHGFYG